MKRIAFLLVSVAAMFGVAASMAPASGIADEGAPWVKEKPAGYRDWKWVSSAHEAGKLNSLGAVLANDVAMKAYRAGTIPFPDGTIIAALHYVNAPSAENDKIFGQPQSFVPGLLGVCALARRPWSFHQSVRSFDRSRLIQLRYSAQDRRKRSVSASLWTRSAVPE